MFIAHVDVDHCGEIDVADASIFPNAQVYLGSEEEAYLTGSAHRMTKLGIRTKNCEALRAGCKKLKDQEAVCIGDIRVQALHISGHTLGHTCYIVDDKVLFSGDCLAVNNDGGYSFFDFFTQYPDMNKRSLVKLKHIVEGSGVKYVCTGHSRMRTDMGKVFKHIDQSAALSKRRPFDKTAPWDFRK